MGSDFDWQPEGGPVNFYKLKTGDFRHVTQSVWNQSDLGDSAMFYTMMIGDFDKSVRMNPSCYPHLFWEAGMMAQMLSVEANSLDFGTQKSGSLYRRAVSPTFRLKVGPVQEHLRDGLWETQ